ncbi:MAG: glycosyltransferase family 4 protein [Vicinamibacterales bacterium]
MHVLHVTPYLAPAWAFGPVPQRVFALARAQQARGLTVTVLTTDAMAPHERLRPGESIEEGVRIVRVASVTGALRSWLNLSTPIGFGRRAARLAAHRPLDVVHLHELHTVENLRVAAVLPRTTCIVLSPHGSARSLTPPWVRGAWHRWGGDALLARTNVVAAASEAEASDIAAVYAGRGLSLEAARTAVVPDGIDLADAAQHATRAEARTRFALHDGPVVLFISRLSDASGIALLIEAFIAWHRVIPSAQLLVVGADYGALAAVRARVTAAGLDAAVHLAGHLTGRDAHLAFAAADLLAVPVRTEGFPTATLEALASGLPVLGEPSEVIQAAVASGVGRMLPPRVGAWASALERAWAELSERPALRETARQVASQFGWNAAAAQLERVYERALYVRP